MSDDQEDFWWSDLSSTELRRRLTQRGVDDSDAELLVARRDDEFYARLIHEVLG